MRRRIDWYIEAIAIVLLLSVTAAICYIFSGSTAKADGSSDSRIKLVLYASLKEAQLIDIEQDFEETAPNIDLVCYSTGSGKAGSALPGLAAASVSEPPDMIWLADPGAFTELLESGQVVPYSGRYAEEIHNRYPGIDSRLTVVRRIRMGFACNRYEFSSNPPSSWAELESIGSVLFADPYNSGTSSCTLYSLISDESFGEGYLRRLKEKGSAIGGGSGAVGYQVGKGKFSIGIIPDYIARMEEEAGLPIIFSYPEDKEITIPSPIAILRSSSRKWAAERFIDFLLSPEGTAKLEELGLEDAFSSDGSGIGRSFSSSEERDSFLSWIDGIFL